MKNKKYKGGGIFIALFLLICLLPSVGIFAFGEAKPAANEIPAARPVFFKKDGKLNLDYLSDFSAYIGDRFALRQELVTIWARMNEGLFRTSVVDDVILGREGWLYFAPTLPDYCGTAPMTERELFCASRTLELLREQAESSGGTFLFTIAPNKNSIYPRYMPGYDAGTGAKNAFRLAERLQASGVPYADLFTALKAEQETLYWHTDSHWNGKGAALGADVILSALGRSSSYYSGPFTASSHTGDLQEMLFPAATSQEADFAYAGGFSFTANTKNADAITIKTEGPGEGSLLMYRDSFGRNLYSYMAEAFESAVFSRKNDYSAAALEENGTMVIELVERNLHYLYTNAHSVPAPKRDHPGTAAYAGGMVSTEAGECSLPGYVRLSGTVSGFTPDDNSPVLLVGSFGCAEAFPTPGGFTACLPEGEAVYEAYFMVNGELVFLPLV